MEGVDYAFSNPNPAGLYAAGKRFAMRYVGPGTSPKHLTVAEADALKRAGLSLVTLVEGATGDPKGGFSVGVSHARQALAMLRARGFPTDRPMYFAVDYDVSATAWPAAREYLHGAGSVIGAGLVGVYGEYDAMVWAARDGVAAWFFQTYAWSGGRWYPGNHVEQYHNGAAVAGGTVDLCRSKKPDFGQWGQAGQAPPTGGEGDDDMAKAFLFQGGYWLAQGGKREPIQDADDMAKVNQIYPGSCFPRADKNGFPEPALAWTADEVDRILGRLYVPPSALTDADRAAIAAAIIAAAGHGTINLTGTLTP